MPHKEETGLQAVATQNDWYMLLNASFGWFCYLLGTSAFIAAMFVTQPPIGDVLYSAMWIPLIAVVTLALLRNKILKFLFGKIPHSSFLSLVNVGKVTNYAVLICASFFFVAGIASNNVRVVAFSVGLFLTWFPIYLIFSEPLTSAGETNLLFELLAANIDNFEKRQPYLIRISRKVEGQLGVGNIKVPRYEFVYYFNMELLKGTQILDDLKRIESWMVDKNTPVFESLRKIYPEDKLEPCRRVPLYKQLVENPAILKYAFAVVSLIILTAVSPSLRDEIVKLLSGLLGI